MPYTTDWFSGNASVWNNEDGPLGDLLRRAQVSQMSALEIGVWEGRSTVWLLENLCMKPGSKVVSVDHFDGGETQAGKDRFERVLLNTRECNQHGALDLRPGWSSVVLIDLRLKERVFDLAYIDGSHHRLETIEDALNAWRCLKPGGVIIFDDYEWDGGFEHENGVTPTSMEHPKVAIDAFMNIVKPDAQILHMGYQVFILKSSHAPTRHAIKQTAPVKALLPPDTVTIEAGVLLPLRCSDEWPADRWVAQLNRNFRGVDAKLYIGIDTDEPGWPVCEQVLTEQLAMPFFVRSFPPVQPAIICPIWASLASAAVDDGCGYLILWGDDVSITPDSWMPSLRAKLRPTDLGCAVPIDANDPSVPTFPIVTSAHFRLFGELFSSKFINQDADPYLFELYRRAGRASYLDGVKLFNGRGGAASWEGRDQTQFGRTILHRSVGPGRSGRGEGGKREEAGRERAGRRKNEHEPRKDLQGTAISPKSWVSSKKRIEH